MKFLSQEMISEMSRRVDDPAIRKSLNGLNISLMMVGTDCPGGEDRQVAFTIKNGILIDTSITIQPSPSYLRTMPLEKSQIDSRFISSYEALVDMVKGNSGVVDSLARIDIEGNMCKLMSQAEGFVNLISFIGSIDMEY